jgi:transcriptional regulator with XRE-family HTH domain
MIREKRLELGLTQQELADKAGVTKNYITMVERGSRTEVNVFVRAILADTLGIPVTELLTAEEVDRLPFLERAMALEHAEVFVGSLQRSLREGRRPPGTKSGAALAIRKVMQARPDRTKEMETLRSRVNAMYA